jgi:putative ABC transport system substrate-binding protein
MAALFALAGGAECGRAAVQRPPDNAPDHAPPASQPLRLGVFFWHDSPNDEAAFEGIRAALGEVGRPHELLVERAGEDPAAAARVLEAFRHQQLDLLFAMGTQAALLAAAHLRDLPVVFTAVTHPVESGVVASWDGSRRNLAGNSNWIAPETILRVFRLALPNLRRLGMLRSREGVVSAAELASMRAHLAEQSTPLEVVDVVVAEPDELAAAVEELAAREVDAIWIPIDRLVYERTPSVFAAASRHGIPLLSSSLQGTRAGATAGLVVDYVMLGKRAAALALAILVDGQHPGSLPVGTMNGYRVVVNVAAARQCGYELPLSVLVLADLLLEDAEDVEDAEAGDAPRVRDR